MLKHTLAGFGLYVIDHGLTISYVTKRAFSRPGKYAVLREIVTFPSRQHHASTT